MSKATVGLGALWRVANRRRLKNAWRYLLSGDISLLRHKVRAVVERSGAAQPALKLEEVLALLEPAENPAAPLDQAVDIIVPVFNNLTALPRLFDSLKANTSSPHRLIIVDDASSDLEVRPYLERRLAEHPGSLFIKRPKNLGFVASVNRAAEQAERSFVILNSDVEVPPGWLERLMAPLLRTPQVASVTPFTNAGTLCSFPTINEDNPLYLDLTVTEIDQAFAALKPPPQAIELPSGVGFCMGINLKVWQDLGGFDEAAFGRGYGEENDWCRRAKKAGYRNILAPNLFVGHDHGGSFGAKESEDLKDRNLLKVHQRHRDYQADLDSFMAADPAAAFRQAAQLRLTAQGAEAGAALVFDHDLGGGANRYRHNRLHAWAAEGRPVLSLTNADSGFLGAGYRLNFRHQKHQTAFKLQSLAELNELSHLLPIDQILCSNILSYPQPLAALDAIAALARQNQAHLAFALHDFFALCPSHNLLNAEGRYCDLPPHSVCDKCLPANRFAQDKSVVAIAAWRQAWSRFIATCDEVLCFSDSSRDLLLRAYPEARGKVVVRPHQLDAVAHHKAKIEPAGPLRIGVIGEINHAKGASVVGDLAALLAQRQPETRIVVLGTLEGGGRHGNTVVTGPYQPDDLPRLIEKHGVNLCFFPSVWPETFSYVVAELMAMELPICCFDLGAPAERLAHYPLGRIIPEVSAEAALAALVALHDELQAR